MEVPIRRLCDSNKSSKELPTDIHSPTFSRSNQRPEMADSQGNNELGMRRLSQSQTGYQATSNPLTPASPGGTRRPGFGDGAPPRHPEETVAPKTVNTPSPSSEYYTASTTATDTTDQNANVFERQPTNTARAETRPSPGFCYQLGITIKRMLLLTSREPLSFLCELLIPIVFVIGTIILWAVFGHPNYDAETYFSTAAITAGTAFYTDIPSFMCVNSALSDGATFGTLPDCTALQAAATDENPLLCADYKSGTPVGVCGTETGALNAYWGWKHVINSQSTLVPTLDEIIPVKWMDRILYSQTSKLSEILPNTDGSSIISFGKLLFAPDTQDTANLVNHLKSTSTYFSHVYGGTFDSEDAAGDLVYKRGASDPPYWGIIVVNSLNADSFDVEIKLNATSIPLLRNSLMLFYVGGVQSDGSEMYLYSGFSTLQKAIYEYYMTKIVVVPTPPTNTVVLPAPTAAYQNQEFVAVGGQMAPLIIVLGFLYPVSQMTKRIVVEKELRLREAMLIMGLFEPVMYVAWLIIYTVQYFFVSLVMALLMKVTYLKESNYGIIFFTLFFFCLSIISLSGLIASFFNQSRLSSLMAPLIFFIMAIPLFAMQNASGGAKAGVSILSPSALAVAFTTIFEHELEGGMNAAALTFFRDSPKMIVIMIMLVVDFVLYSILMLYFDAVLPREWGTTKHPLFFILDPIKCCCGKKEEQDTSAGPDGRAENGVFEPVTDADKSAIRIEGLRKVFHRGKDHFVAVNNFYWTMREGEISVLLGHNGAGKTTTMNMMTGMIEADAGDCYIYDKSVRYDLTGARHEIGYCPQHNILWPNLTCREHLWYYASVKGLRGEEREAAIEKMLIGVDLMDKAEYHSANLSGGQKRKLSVAVAFVGGSRLVFLDEPTAGMDVGARRHTWALLREMSLRHSILLTTHFMDEADLLGDTIAIMSKGSMQCCGSSLFLKSNLGVGYVLTMSVVAHVDRAPIASLVQKYVPGAEQLGSGAGEVAYRLPMEAKSSFPPLLREIEDGGSRLGVNAYSISATTLEEIFLQIAKEAEENEVAAHASTKEEAPPVERTQNADVWNVPLIQKESTIAWSQLKAMLWKRLWNSLRDRRTQFFQIVCPVVCVLLAMLLMLIKLFEYPNKLLNSNMYGTDVEVDVVGCPAMNLDIPFSSSAITYSPASVTTTEGLSDYMQKTYYRHATGKERYGGLTCDDSSGAAIFYNSSALHEVGIGMYNLYNGYFMAAKGKDNILKTTAGSMRQTKTQSAVQNSVYTMLISVIIMIPFTFIPSTFVSWIVKERQCKARHLQNVSGLFFSIYWLANYMFDTVSYIITMVLVIIVFLIFDRTEYVGRDSIGATFILLFLYGLSGIAMAYLVSFLFDDHSSAQNIVMLGNFIAGFLLVLCILMLSIISSTEDVAHVLRWFFRVVPSYCVGEGISNLALLKMEKAFGTNQTAYSMNIIGWPCIYMAIEIPFFVFGTLFIDHPGRRQRAQRLFHNADAPAEEIEDEDVDVIGERDAVLNSEERKKDLVSVEHLRKVYDNGKVAVRNITFGVKPGEVFGFLGTNGAGKTTTISILCQEFFPTSGHASVCGNDIVENSREALRCIGYCPQFDATIDLLTAEEHLQLYAGVRGIEYDARPKVVEGLLSLCELTSYRDTQAHEMSGGNRRKLSVAISLIGGPRVVFLDEPSAGMDPVARRGLWTAIETVADNCSVVLTTHHLEEVEALAHRVAIMVDGTLRCIGDKTHLKQKYGSGFEVNVRISTEDEAVKEGVIQFFAKTFPGSELREYRAKRFTFELPGSTKLSNTFKVLEENVDRLKVTDYNVSQTSIEQVFMQISQEAEGRGDD